MHRFPRLGLICVLIGGYLVVFGCGGTDSPLPTAPNASPRQDHDHDHDQDHDHDHGHADAEVDQHASFAEAVSRLDAIHATIKEAMEAGDTANAHGPLHQVGHALKHVEVEAKKAPLSAADREAVDSAVEELFAGYGAVDARMHGREGKTYEEASAQIDAAMETLRAKAAPSPEEN